MPDGRAGQPIARAIAGGPDLEVNWPIPSKFARGKGDPSEAIACLVSALSQARFPVYSKVFANGFRRRRIRRPIMTSSKCLITDDLNAAPV